MGKINIRNLEVFANHGVFPEENVLGQKFIISATLHVSTYKAGHSDEITDSVHYGEVSHFMKSFAEGRTYKLIESLAERMAEAVLKEFGLIKRIDLEIKKPWAPIGLPLEDVSIQISRGWHTAYIAIGSNIGDKKAYVDGAVCDLDELEGCCVVKTASYIETEPYGGVEQDDFLNTVLELKTLLPPEVLLERLHDIENAAGRERNVRWGPRTLDLDIILYDNLILDTPDLTIPHMEMHKRDFVLKPLMEIAPYLRHPATKNTVKELWEKLDKKQ